jgi:hypothetical protein
MQTFLPEGADLELGFKRLDRQRLGKQRVETFQILNVLRGIDKHGDYKNHKGWSNHPCTVMWRGHAYELARYGYLCSLEWIDRGYKDTMSWRFCEAMESMTCDNILEPGTWDLQPPPWIEDEAVYISHRSNLIRKDPDYYKPYWPDVPDSLDYVWPADPTARSN